MEKMTNNNFLEKYSATLILIIAILFCSYEMVNAQSTPEEAIIGTWISQPDGNSKWVFTSDSTAKIYLNGELKKIFTYKISNTSPQCGINVQKFIDNHPQALFLELTNPINRGLCKTPPCHAELVSASIALTL